MTSKKKKRIEEYKRTKPVELDSFQSNPLSGDIGQYSNLIEFYDSIPRLFPYNSKRENGKYLPTFERLFVFHGKEYEVSLQPARIKTKDGEKEFFPGRREELIQDTLRKIAIDSKDDCMFFDGMVGVKFTLQQLRKKMEESGCSISINEIKQSLEICASSIMKIKAVNGEGDQFTHISSLLTVLILTSRAQYENGQQNCLACFHQLVTNGITNKTFRLYDYKKGMSLKSLLSSYLYKRLCYNFLQAGTQDVYSIKLTTLVRDAGLDLNLPLWRNLEKAKLAIQELIEHDIVKNVKYDKKKEGRKVKDVKITIWVTDEHISKTMKSHFVSKELGINQKSR